VFYAAKSDEIEVRVEAEAALDTYVKKQQRSSDLFKTFESTASANGQSVAAYLAGRNDDLMRFVSGDASTNLEQLRADLARYDVGDNDVVRDKFVETRRNLRSRNDEIDGLKKQLGDARGTIAEKEAQIDSMRENQRRELEKVSQEIVTYRDQSEQYSDQVRQTLGDMNQAVERLEDQYEDRIGDLEDDVDAANQEVVLLRARVDEYEKIFDKIRMKATSPELLVDGSVIDVDTGREHVFINRGKRNRIVLGMTFEVYDDAASIRPNPQTGVMPRGKASMQVIKVAETTSTCKLTRTIPGRPVVRNNVIANAIYDPDYRFKFLIHGKFDVDGDGRPSEAEAEYLRSRVVDWGGEIIIGEEIPGDLDFLVLGEEPRMPLPLRADSSEAQTRVWVQKQAALVKYRELKRQASEAQIPVLNANRFFILIGSSR
jgi:archaellum component FlaC